MKNLVLFERFYSPPLEMKERLSNIVRQLEDEFGGGKKFFDALDDHIKDVTNEDMVLALVKGYSKEWISSSGEFGDRLYEMWKDGKFNCLGLVVFNGKLLTNDDDVKSWYPKDFELDGKKFIYIDDSYFSGGTAKKINEFLKGHNSKIKSVSVIYDGSEKKKKGVSSFFRYH